MVLDLEAGFGRQGRPAGTQYEPVEHRLGGLRIGMAHVVIDLRKLGDDVRSVASRSDHMMNPRLFWGVFAQKLCGMVHQFNPVQRRAAFLGGSRCVGCLAVKAELRGHPRQGRRITCRIPIARMPVQDCVTTLEQPGSGHEDLTGPPLLGRAAEQKDRSGLLSCLDLVGEGQGGRD